MNTYGVKLMSLLHKARMAMEKFFQMGKSTSHDEFHLGYGVRSRIQITSREESAMSL
jgi:hypothetical protein